MRELRTTWSITGIIKLTKLSVYKKHNETRNYGHFVYISLLHFGQIRTQNGCHLAQVSRDAMSFRYRRQDHGILDSACGSALKGSKQADPCVCTRRLRIAGTRFHPASEEWQPTDDRRTEFGCEEAQRDWTPSIIPFLTFPHSKLLLKLIFPLCLLNTNQRNQTLLPV